MNDYNRKLLLFAAHSISHEGTKGRRNQVPAAQGEVVWYSSNNNSIPPTSVIQVYLLVVISS